MLPSGLVSMVTAPPPPPKPHLVAPGTGTAAQPPAQSQHTAFGPVNARQENRIGAQDIDVEVTQFGGLGMALAVVALLGLVAFVVWWLL